MGNKCSWVAVRDMSLGEVLVDLELGVTGEQSDEPFDGLSVVETLEDWIVVLAAGADSADFIEEANARGLSVDGWALLFRCDGDDTELREYRDGERTWTIAAGPELSTAGALPEAISEVIDDAREKGGALGDMPVKIGRMLTGFGHDGGVRAESDEPFLEIEPR